MQERSRRAFVLGGIGFLLAACDQGQAGTVGYSVSTSGEGNLVVITQVAGETGDYVATIHSVRGIGQASVVWWGNPLPHQLTFHVHLAALESFRLRWIDQSVSVSVSSTDQTVSQALQVGNQPEGVIMAGRRYWMDVALPTAESPLFQLAAPAAFLSAAPKLWGVAWVDFYR